MTRRWRCLFGHAWRRFGAIVDNFAFLEVSVRDTGSGLSQHAQFDLEYCSRCDAARLLRRVPVSGASGPRS